MKRFTLFVAFVALMLSSVSCEKDPFNAFLDQKSYDPKAGLIVDFNPIQIGFIVTDGQGRNLFDESTPGNWLSEPLSATFDGRTFKGVHRYDWPGPETKAYLAELKGFYIYPSWYTQAEEVILIFGEIDGAEKWDSDLTVSWPDGSKDVIMVQHALRWNAEGYPESYTGLKVNGRRIDGRTIRLTK